MKNKSLTIIGIIILLVIISLSYIFVINNGKIDIKKGNEIKELTFEEKTKLIEQVDEKYVSLNKETNEKYDKKINEINDKYTSQIEEIEKKYKDLETEIENTYNAKIAEIDKKIDAIRREQTADFFANGGITEKHDELGAQITELNNQKSRLRLEKSDNESKNNRAQSNELSPINANKTRELNTNEESRNLEISRLKQSKDSEIYNINYRKSNKQQLISSGIRKIIWGVIIIIIPFLYIALVFNKLTQLKNKVKESWAQIDVLLKKRSDLIPNILEAVKGYSKYEKSTLEDVTKARNKVMKANSIEEEMESNNKLSIQIGKIFALKEAYPELKADENFMDLQDNLKKIEDELARSRQLYNKSVLRYKNRLEIFPSNIVANTFSFKAEPFFDTDDTENVNIKFD